MNFCENEYDEERKFVLIPSEVTELASGMFSARMST